MKVHGNNLIMVDYALHDRRSVGAMLRGDGDRREQKWIEFSEKNRGFFTEEDLYFLFRKQCERDQIAAEEMMILRKVLIALGVLIAVVF